PAENVAPLTGPTIAIAGCAFRTTRTGSDVAVEPRLSVAFAVSALVPAGAFVQTKLKGATDDSPSLFVPLAKNSTFTTEPSGSVAVTAIGTLVGVMAKMSLF